MLELLNTMEKNQGWGIVLGEGAGVFSLRKHHLSKPKDLGEEVVTRGKSIPERVISKAAALRWEPAWYAQGSEVASEAGGRQKQQ